MGPNYIALAIPVFFACIAIELGAARLLGRRVYRFEDALSDLGAGVLSELAKLFLHGAMLAGYLAVYRHRLHDLSGTSVWVWLAAAVAVDFLYYWWHRASHEVNLLWAAHVVHHTSEDYNLAVALRQSVTTHATAIPFYLVLALVGVPPTVYVTVYSFNILYQFFVHTELCGKLGPLEWVLNTPSHHRVHHAINPQYLDKNHAGILIVWDRLFGSFAEEVEPPVYGTVKPLRSYDPLWIQVHYFVELWRESRRAPSREDRLRLWWKSPAWHPEGLRGYPSSEGVSRERFVKYDPTVSPAARLYLGAWFAAAVVLATVLIFNQASWPLPRLAVGSVLVVMTLLGAAALIERRPWARAFEAARLLAVAGGAALMRYVV